MKKYLLFIMIASGTFLFGCSKTEYCWQCQGSTNASGFFDKEFCGYTEDEIEALMNNMDDDQEFFWCRKKK